MLLAISLIVILIFFEFDMSIRKYDVKIDIFKLALGLMCLGQLVYMQSMI